jgi:hypothetical protein
MPTGTALFLIDPSGKKSPLKTLSIGPFFIAQGEDILSDPLQALG